MNVFAAESAEAVFPSYIHSLCMIFSLLIAYVFTDCVSFFFPILRPSKGKRTDLSFDFFFGWSINLGPGWFGCVQILVREKDQTMARGKGWNLWVYSLFRPSTFLYLLWCLMEPKTHERIKSHKHTHSHTQTVITTGKQQPSCRLHPRSSIFRVRGPRLSA